MSEDAASLHLKVNTSEVDKGKKALDDLAKTGEKTEKSIKDLGTESARSKRSIDQLGESAKTAGDGAKSATAGFSSFRSVVAALGMVSMARDAIAMADSYTKMTAQLKIATSSTEEYKKAMQSVKQISSVAQADIMAITALYSRLSTSLKEVGTSQKSIAAITETVALALKVGGASSGEAASAMLQLSQAFASGVLRGEEFNAVSESAPNLLRALAASMQIPFGELRKLASQGQITSDVLTRAFSDPALLSQMRKQAKDVTTISGAFTNLQNSILLFVGANDKAVGSSSMMAKFLNGIADKIEQITIKTQGLWLAAQKFIGMDGEKPGSQESSGKIRGVELPKFTPDVNLRFMQKQYDDLFKSFSDGEISAKKFTEEVKKAYIEAGYLAGVDKEAGKAAKQHAADVAQLMESIKRRIAAERLQLALGRDLTNGEKALSDVKADMASKAVTLSDKEFKLYEAFTKELDAVEKLSAANEKLKKAREEIAGIVTSAATANAEYLERLEFENSLIGKSALQVAQLTAAYQSNLTLKRQFADIDKATKGLTDPAAIAKLKAESDARIKAIKDEARAKIEAKYIADVQQTIKVRSDPAITQEMGARLMPEEVARRTAAAKAEHDAALAKIADLDVIQGRLKIEEELKAKINKAELEAHDIELARATGASIMADEAAEKIAKYGADNVAYAEAALAISRDTGLQEYRGFEERNKQLQARVEFFTAEAEAKKTALGVSANQLEFDKANLTLQQQLYQIQLDAGDLDEQKKLGLAHQIKMQDELIGFLARKRNLDMSQVGSGEELVEINKELLRLKKAIDGLDVGAEAKAKAQADAAKTQLEAAQKLADTAKKTMNVNMVQQFESDFHNGMLRLLEAGNTSWGAMMKGWKNSFKVNVVDYIYKQLAKPYIFKFIASFAGLVGANGVASAANTAADAALAGTSTTSWMSILKGGYDALSGGFKAFGDLVSTGLSKAGVSATNAGMAGTAASYLGAGMAGVTIGTFIAGDKTLLGMSGMTTSVLGAALSAALLPGLGPIGLFIGGIAGGALNALFGMGPKQYGQTTVKGGFSGEGFAGKMVTPWTQKGGVFRKGRSGEDPSPLGEPAQQFLNSLVGKSGASFARLITLSGDAARSVDGWSFAINRALTTEEDMTKLFGDMADSMGTFVIPELEKFRAKGENLADTAVRMGDEYVITESIFRMMGFTAAATGIASLGMRDSLIQLMGGIQQTSATMDSYYKNFYTADEQQANSLRQVNDAFKVLGLVAPTTRDGFRALAETLVKDTTPAGQALFASVMALNPAFAAVTQSTEDMAAAMVQSAKDIADAQNAIIDAAKKTLDAAFAGVQRAVQAERDSITKQYTESLSVVNASISKLTSLSSALKSSVAGLNPLGRGQAQAEIKTALMLAKLGVFPTADSMARALQSVAQPGERLFRTFEDYKRDQILTSNDIEALGRLTDDQLSVEERTLKTLEDMQAGEMSRLDGILKGAQDQIDAINGVNNSVLSVAAALFAMSAALTNFQLQSVTTSAMQTGMGITNVNGLLAFSGGDASAAASSSTGYSASEILARRLGQRAAIDSVASPISLPVIATPPSAFNINDMSTWTQQQKDDWRKGGKWPSFAVGTNYVPQDMTARIHEGEAIIPKAYNRNNDATNAALVAVIQELKAEVKQARIEANANALPIAVNTSKSAKLAEKWEGLGMPVTRT